MPGEDNSEEQEFWVCAGCGKPTKTYLERFLQETGFYG